ncbi:hypothetical protein C8Q70DRAFT_664362 [Cubamyces menziesii]|nr:hypothetical protein C8Q70DRAFT_664362 [Cubamyces menziesii]
MMPTAAVSIRDGRLRMGGGRGESPRSGHGPSAIVHLPVLFSFLAPSSLRRPTRRPLRGPPSDPPAGFPLPKPRSKAHISISNHRPASRGRALPVAPFSLFSSPSSSQPASLALAMRIAPHRKARQDSGSEEVSIAGFGGVATVATTAAPTDALAFNTQLAQSTTSLTAPPLNGDTITLPPTSTPTPTVTQGSSGVAESGATSASKGSQIPLGAVIGACVGAFVVVVLIICLVYAWYKRSTDKLSAAARRNAAGEAEQQRANPKNFNRLDSPEKRRNDLPPPSPGTREQHESDEKNFSMFKKSPSVRTAYTTKTNTDEDQVMDLPQLDFTKYHPTLAQELALEQPEKPYANVGRQNSGVSWDGETLGDDSFLSMHSMRVDSGTMSPTMVMAKMTPPATASAVHKWESAEVLNVDDDEHAQAAPQPSRNPFADMAEERRARNNPFFNAQDMTRNRNSRAIRSRSNSRTSRAQSLVRSESRATQHTVTQQQQNTNPFLDLQDAVPLSSIDVPTPDTLTPNHGLPQNKASVPSGASASAFGNEHAMASLIAALDLSKEQVEERLRVVSMQGSLVSAYSENDESDIATVREWPLPPGTTKPVSP